MTHDQFMKRKDSLGLLISLVATLALLLMAVLPVSVAAQVPTIVREQTVIYNEWPVPTHFNPLVPNPGAAMHLTYEYLFLTDDVNLKLIPWLAESAQWVDDLTLEVKTRSAARWQDGEPLTAEDVKYSYEFGQRHPETTQGNTKTIWVYVDSIELVDEHTLRFHIKPENPVKLVMKSLLETLILPKHIWEKVEEDYPDFTEFTNIYPVGSGPYQVVYHDETRVISQRYDAWWGATVAPTSDNPYLGKLPEPKTLIGLRVTDNEECARLLISGGIDASQCFYPAVWEHFDEGIVTWFDRVPYLGPTPKRTGGFYFNLEHYPANVTAVRKAIAFAINRTDICEKAFSKYAVPVDITFITPDSPLAFLRSQEAINTLDIQYDPDYAKQILDDANIKDTDGDGIREMPDGAKLSFTGTVPEGWTDWQIALEMLSTYAEAIGIKIDTVYTDSTTWTENIRAGSFDISNYQFNAWTVNGVYDFYRNVLDSRTPTWPMITGLPPRYNNTEVWSAIDEIAKYWDPSDPAIRDTLVGLYGQLQMALARDLPSLPVWAWDNPVSYQTKYWVGWPSEENPGPRINVDSQPEFLMVLLKLKSVGPAAVTTTVTSTVTSVSTSVVTTTLAAQTVTTTVSAVDVTSVAGAGVVALIVGVVVGWLVASRKR